VDFDVSVNTDGTGKIKQVIGLNKEMLNDLLISISKGKKPAKENENALIEKEFRKKAVTFGEGVEFEGFTKEVKDDFTYFTIVYAFKDINKIKVDVQGGGVMDTLGLDDVAVPAPISATAFSLKKSENGQAVLTIKSPFSQTASQKTTPGPDSKKEPPPTTPEEEADFERMMKDYLKDAQVSLSVTCGSVISQTNATYQAGNKIIFLEGNGNKLLAAIEKKKGLIKIYEKINSSDIPTMKNGINELIKISEGAFKLELVEEINIQFK
jgi:hypothetical protein